MMFYAADYRRLARENLRGSWGLSIAVIFMATLLGGPVGGASMSIEIPQGLQALIQEFFPNLFLFLKLYTVALGGLNIAQIILGGAIGLGNAQYQLDQYDHNPLAFKTLFSKFHQFGAGLCVSLLIGLYCLLWFLVPLFIGSFICIFLDLTDMAYLIVLVLLCLIPALIASYSYSLSYYILAEYPELRSSEAIRTSRDLMRGRKWELFCLNFSFLGWNLLAFLTLGLGLLFVGPYNSAAIAAFYRQIKSPRETPAQLVPAQPELPAAE